MLHTSIVYNMVMMIYFLHNMQMNKCNLLYKINISIKLHTHKCSKFTVAVDMIIYN